MFCTTCGAGIPESNKFCTACGTAVIVPDSTQVDAVSTSPMPVIEPEPVVAPLVEPEPQAQAADTVFETGNDTPEPAVETVSSLTEQTLVVTPEDTRQANEISDLYKIITEKNENLAKSAQEIERLAGERNQTDFEKSQLTERLQKTKNGLVAAIILGGIVIAVLIGVGSSKYREMKNRYYGLASSNNSLKKDYDKLSTEYEKSKEIWAINVTSMQVGNWGDNGWLTQSGESLKAQDMRYLTPVMTYNSLISGGVTFYVKIIRPDGTINRNESISPDGYSYSSTHQVSRGNNQSLNLTGWGKAGTSSYTAGKYTVEVWYEGVCLRSEKVKLN